MNKSSSFTTGNTSGAIGSDICCPRFDPALWQDREVSWNHKRFVKGHVRSIVHIPLNFGSVMKDLQERIERVGAMEEPRLYISDENSLWGSDLFVAVTKDVPGCTMATISGTFLTKVFEGPYRNAGRWAQEMTAFVHSKGRELGKLYFFYTTCPLCAKTHGKNYVVLFAKIS